MNYSIFLFMGNLFMTCMRFFYLLVMDKRLIFEELFEYMFGDKPLEKKLFVNGNSLNGFNFCI